MIERSFLNYNGKIYKSDRLFISPNNRSFRYGDGCFETIKLLKGKIVLEDFHFERLFNSIEQLQFDKPEFLSRQHLKDQIVGLARMNVHDGSARVRLTMFGNDEGLHEAENHSLNYLIQTWKLNPVNNIFNETGLAINVYKDARKVCDKFSAIKSNNFLCYLMGALWAKKNKLNDSLLLNPCDRVADATIANVFIIKEGVIKTPALSEGCINGNMRRHLLKSIREENLPVEETKITIQDLLESSEIFLTNVIYGIRWVKSCGGTNYKMKMTKDLYNKFVAPLYD